MLFRSIQLTKSLGQNFLHDGNQLRRIVTAADLRPTDRVLEVGPGLGPLTELLLAKGYEVHGLIRRASTFNTGRIDHIYEDPHSPNPKLFLHYGDLTDGVGLTNLVRDIHPTEIYNLAAQSHVMVSFTMPQYTAQVDAVGTVAILEAIRASKLDIRFYQASTSELYGSTPPPQNEESKFRPRSPYAAAKLMA